MTFAASALTTISCGESIAPNPFYGDPSVPTQPPYEAGIDTGPLLPPFKPDADADADADAGADADADAGADADAAPVDGSRDADVSDGNDSG